MKSPFFWQNAGLLLLLIANFAFGVWLVVRTPAETPVDNVDSAAIVEGSSNRKNPTAWRIILRVVCVIYATASCLILFVLGLQFCENEFSALPQECWRQRNSFPQIKLGMTQKQVAGIVGEPQDVYRRNDNDQYRYLLSPSGLPEYASVSFNADPKNAGGDVVVVDKWPDDGRLNALNGWWRSHLYCEYWSRLRTLCDKAMVLCWLGILLVALATLLPFWPCKDWHSLALYLPAVALTLGITNEATQRIGWRYDLMVLVPAYFVIAVVWVFRVIHVANK